MTTTASLLVVSLLALGAAGSQTEEHLLRAHAERFELRAESLEQRGQLEEARIVLTRALQLRAALDGPEGSRAAVLHRRLGDLLLREKRPREADLHYLRALAIRRGGEAPLPAREYPGVESPFRQPARDTWRTASERNAHAEALRRDRRDLQASGHLRRAWKAQVEALGPYQPRDLRDGVAIDAHREGTRLYQRGRFEEAEPLFRRALRIWLRELGEDDPRVMEIRWRLTRIRRRTGRRFQDRVPAGLANLHLDPPEW